MSTRSITTRFSIRDLKGLDKLVKKGYFTNRSDAIRTSVRFYLQMDKIDIPPIIKEMSAVADRVGITREDIVETSRKVRRQIYEEEYGD